MRGVLLRWAPLALLLTTTVALLLVLAPIDRRLLLRIYALAIGGLTLATLTAATAYAARRTRSRFAEAMRQASVRHGRPEELERLERQVALAIDNAADFHFRLRPTLVAAVDAALWRRHGVGLAQGERLVSPELWEVVRPDLPPPADRRAPGPTLERVQTLVGEIERMQA